MRTIYIRLYQHHNDPVLGPLVIDWVRSPLIRVTSNCLGKSVWEWVGHKEIDPAHLASWRRSYPLAMIEVSDHEPLLSQRKLP